MNAGSDDDFTFLTDFETLRRAVHKALQDAALRAYDFKQYCEITDRAAKSKAAVVLGFASSAARMIEELDGLGSVGSVAAIPETRK